ncbi:MAG: EamA/RhaT family transporter, partial [Xanthobacteraceae bacterium]
MNLLKAILLKVGSAFVFAVMSVLVRWLGERFPVGQIVFFRSVFAIRPVISSYAWRNDWRTAVRTARLRG